jgi:hypothetical protein
MGKFHYFNTTDVTWHSMMSTTPLPPFMSVPCSHTHTYRSQVAEAVTQHARAMDSTIAEHRYSNGDSCLADDHLSV